MPLGNNVKIPHHEIDRDDLARLADLATNDEPGALKPRVARRILQALAETYSDAQRAKRRASERARQVARLARENKTLRDRVREYRTMIGEPPE